MTDRELMQMALDALDEARDAIAGWGSYASPYFQEKHNLEGDIDDCDAVIEELRARLAQPEPEPVAWRVWNRMGGISFRQSKPDASEYVEFDALYTAPPQREWQGLTDEEMRDAILASGGWRDTVRFIEAKLKEKNA